MAVKAKYTKQTEIPEALKNDYKQVGDVWLLDVEGGNTATHVPKEEFDRVKLESKTRKETLDKFKGPDGKELDPDTLRADLAELAPLRESKGDTERAVNAATSRMKVELQTEKDKNATLTTRLSTLVVGSKATELAAKSGVRPEAVPDFEARFYKDFEEKDGNLTPKNNLKGGKGDPLTPQEWADGLKASAGHLFQGTAGGGSGDSSSSRQDGGQGSKPNPYKKGPTWNLTQQGLLELGNPTEAARLQQEAGLATT